MTDEPATTPAADVRETLRQWWRAPRSRPTELTLAALVTDMLADAWDEGFKQGGPMHDENYDDPDAHTRNPYRSTP